ncbi:MAG: rRNA pseudouridine synthase, partial [Myxococcales bacterium]|nr:rRNA pseudouridine synthase [Myxococcales bacterium]
MTARRKRRAPAARTAAPDGAVRLQKLLALAGFGSRRACEKLVEEGRVTVDGRVATLGDAADPVRQRVALDGERLELDRPSYWVVNKPRGVLTTLRDPEGRRTVMALVPAAAGRVFPVGRLDADTEGLLLLTNDGAMAHALLHPSLGSEREYVVVAKGELGDAARGRLERGVRLEDGPTAPARVEAAHYDPESDTTRLRLVLREGRKRQIRRSLIALGHPVKRLERVRMGPLRLGRLERGAARALRADEVERLRAHCRALARGRAGGGSDGYDERGERAA